MQVLISDANVLIDMEDGGLLELMFNLPFRFQVSDILFHEELKTQHPICSALDYSQRNWRRKA